MITHRAVRGFVSSHFQSVTASIQHPGLKSWFRAFVITVVLATTTGLAFLTPLMAPVKPGTAVLFWKAAAGVQLDGDDKEEWIGGAYFIDDEWVAYEISHLHGSDLYCVPVNDVLPHFDRVIELLQQGEERGKETSSIRGYVKWREIHFQQRNAQALVRCTSEALGEVMAKQGPGVLAAHLSGEQFFWKRWQQSYWYWANVVFEWTVLCGLALFVAWPVLRARSPLKLSLHVAISPTLFLLPTYLGYSTTSFTSAGPSGGILYPFLVGFFRGGRINRADQWLLNRLPQILEPLSPSIGQPMALTGFGMPGPTSAIIGGLVIGACVLEVSAWIRSACQRRI